MRVRTVPKNQENPCGVFTKGSFCSVGHIRQRHWSHVREWVWEGVLRGARKRGRRAFTHRSLGEMT